MQVGSLDGDVFDSFDAELRRCRRHCDRTPQVDHRTWREHECDERCGPHVCTPLSDATIRQIHFVLAGALRRAVRWRWIGTSPIAQAEPPPAPKPDPRPPTAGEATRILQVAWADPEWALLLWVAMVTGMRRGELCALRWSHIDLDGGVVSVRRSIWQRSTTVGEKDTKTHQQRRIALDPETLALLSAHRDMWTQRVGELGAELADDAFVFSNAPDGSKHLLPDSVSQRFGKLVRRLRITSSIHKLRHYSATELIAAGVDPRTVAGRLGHGGGGTTTLRYYSAWVSEVDHRAASTLAARMPVRPADAESTEPSRPNHPYERVAAAIRGQLLAGSFPVGAYLPGQKRLAVEYGVAVGTAHRAVGLLVEEGLVGAVAGHGFEVLNLPETAAVAAPAPEVSASDDSAPDLVLLDFVVRRGPEEVTRFSAEADPNDPRELRKLLLGAVRRQGYDEDEPSAFELEVLRDGNGTLLRTFVATRRRGTSPTGNA